MSNVIDLELLKKRAMDDMSIGDIINALGQKKGVIEGCVIYRDESNEIHMVAYENISSAFEMVLDMLDVVYEDAGKK
jgi:hypothetical protein